MSLKTICEVNFDCLIGPTHNFSGLSLGNTASTKNKNRISSPKKAALQGLEKMRMLAQRGFIQGILPPHERPCFDFLRNIGFCGQDHEIAFKIKDAFLINNASSSSAMWAANSATISPALDCEDNKTHLTPANLVNKLHRSFEPNFTYQVFKRIFPNDCFMLHEPLYAHDVFSDEGAANFNRIAPSHAHEGIEIFVYSKASEVSTQKSKIFPSRQSLEASKAIARLHKLKAKDVLFVEQNPFCIDAGAFHNDVVCSTNENVMLLHERAFLHQQDVLPLISKKFQEKFNEDLFILQIKDSELHLENAIASYLFNSQILSKENGNMILFAPQDAKEDQQTINVIERILSENNPIDEVLFFNISESMANGGGPACLRLRFVLSPKEIAAIKPCVFLTEERFLLLKKVVEKYYVDEFKLEYLQDKNFLDQSKCALHEISMILDLQGIYSFQK